MRRHAIAPVPWRVKEAVWQISWACDSAVIPDGRLVVDRAPRARPYPCRSAALSSMSSMFTDRWVTLPGSVCRLLLPPDYPCHAIPCHTMVMVRVRVGF